MMNTKTTSTTASEFAAFVGLDWADQKHALSLAVSSEGAIERTTLAQTPQAIADWANGLRARFPNGLIAVCLEQSRGPLLYALMQYEHLVLYPLNPKSLARFREALYPSHAKNDPTDADLALELVRKHRDRLRPWEPDTPQTRQLALLVEHRRSFVDLQTQLSNELTAHLKAVFPQALELVGEALASRMATDFLKKWPTLQQLKKVKPAALRKFYYAHNSRSESLIQQRLKLIETAVPLTQDAATVNAHALAIGTLASQLAALLGPIAKYDAQIQELFVQHPDAAIFASLPGAGDALAPRLLVGCGSDRQRFEDAEAISSYTGIAPITEKSGQTQHWVHMRWSCPTFLRQSWHEFAACSIKFSRWARCFYDHLRDKGKGHHAAVRALAFKWQRIVWRLWVERTPYDEERYIATLLQRGLGIYQPLAKPGKSALA